MLSFFLKKYFSHNHFLSQAQVRATQFVGSSRPLSLRFAQVKGSLEEDAADADVISAIEFDESGNLLATGDKGGRIVVFERNLPPPQKRAQSPIVLADYNVYSTFQSHQPEFDYLKSLEIEEKINQIRWLRQRTNARFLLSTNDKTIKLWKLLERHKFAQGFNFPDEQDLSDLYSSTFGAMPHDNQASTKRQRASTSVNHVAAAAAKWPRMRHVKVPSMRESAVSVWKFGC